MVCLLLFLCFNISLTIKQTTNKYKQQQKKVPGSVMLPTAISIVSSVPVPIVALLIDRRGTGLSNPIDCPPPGLFGDPTLCIATLRRIRNVTLANTITNTAMDLGTIVALVGRAFGGGGGGGDDMLFVSSQSTYLALRYLQLFPSQMKRIAMDAILPASPVGFVHMVRNANDAAMSVFAQCNAEPTCAQHFANNDSIQVSLIFSFLQFMFLILKTKIRRLHRCIWRPIWESVV